MFIMYLNTSLLKCWEECYDNYILIEIHVTLAVPGDALLWLSLVNWKRKRKKKAHVSNLIIFVGRVVFNIYAALGH